MRRMAASRSAQIAQSPNLQEVPLFVILVFQLQGLVENALAAFVCFR